MAPPAEHEVVYDIRLQDRVPEPLRSEFPTMEVRSTGPRTVLRMRADQPDQLSAVLEKVRSVGGTITGLHRCVGTDPKAGAGSTYEVWVGDELGAPLLRYLHCAHRVVPQPTQIRVSLGTSRMLHFVRACASSGATIISMHRVDAVPET